MTLKRSLIVNNPQVVIRPSLAPKEVEFVQIKVASPKRLVLSVDGPPKSGKTHFTLTAPGPITEHDLDLGLEGVVEQEIKRNPDKVIYSFQYAIPHSAALPGSPFAAMADAARGVWETFCKNFRASIPKSRTVVVDTGSEAWNLCRLARLGKLVQVMPVQYTAVNSEFRQLTQLALLNSETNVIYTHKMKAVYKNDQKTEEVERAGFGDIEYDVQAVVRTERDFTKVGIEQFSVLIEECRLNPLASGMRFTGADCSFQKVAVAIYPDTTEDFWR
jgi:hypothetical protein